MSQSHDPRRRDFIAGTAALAAASTLPHSAQAGHGDHEHLGDFELAGKDRAALALGLQNGSYTALGLTRAYLERIQAHDARTVNAVIELNPDAEAIAAQLDAEHKAGKTRGPLHGLPLLIKDNIDTGDRMHTTAGSLALADWHAPVDAPLVASLRAAGAVILGKTNLSEWANARSTRSSSGWSARGGQTTNAYDRTRSPSGSSSGTGAAIAMEFAALGIGTETDGSIISPANANGLVGLKPTLGLVPRTGIIPISHSQDTAGPMTRSVADAAALLAAIVQPNREPGFIAAPAAGFDRDYLGALKARAAQGARIGVARGLFGFHPDVDALAENAIRALKDLGAEIIDEVKIDSIGQFDDSEFDVLSYELKADLNAYLTRLPKSAPARTLAELIEFNRVRATLEMPFFGQEWFESAQAKGPLSDPAYRDALAKNHELSRSKGIDAAFSAHRLDALIGPSGGPAWLIDHINGDHYTGGNTSLAAVAGYPHLTVPMGFVQHLPVGLSFIGLPYSEARLLGLGYAFEQATRARKSPFRSR
ncbi:MAG: amidase [Rhodanobacteraceae bacterium]|nr:amidase [Rhodanobacteraceae bacterium]